MKPVLGYYSQEEIETFKREGGVVKSIVAAHLGISARDIIEYELCLYPAEKAALTGISGEYFQSARIDDLSMAFAGLEALLRAPEKSDATRVLAVFDNEETGSGTKQGAASPVLRDAMDRIVRIIEGDDPQNTYMAVANSFMISADDVASVIKINANCKYMTDAQGAAVFSELCDRAGVRCQYFVNHADVAGGSTLGNISSSQFDIRGVDMGNAIWAMHSARETAGVTDHIDTVKVFNLFYQ